MRCPLKVLAYDLRPEGIQGKEYELRISNDPDGTPHRQLMCTDWMRGTNKEADKYCAWWNCEKLACGMAV